MALQDPIAPVSYVDDLALNAKNGQTWAEEELIRKYEKIIIRIIKKKGFYLPKGEDADLVQEGLIGLFLALKRYEPGRDFNRFAIHCIYRHLASALKTANYKKHISFNPSTSLDAPCSQSQMEQSLGHFLADRQPLDPLDYIIQQEIRVQVQLLIQSLNLTWLELNVLKGILNQLSYEDIAEKYGISKKSVDNAMQRIKLKAKKKVLTRKHHCKTATGESIDELWLVL